MALIVEDGSLVADSNSYVSRANYIAYALTFGVPITDDSTADVELLKAAQYIDHHEPNLKGYRSTRNQTMAFPRVGVVIDSWYWNANEIPRQAIQAQQAFALDVHNGNDLFNKSVNPNLVASKERVEGAVSVENVIQGGEQKLTMTSTGDSLLNQLLNRNGLTLVRT